MKKRIKLTRNKAISISLLMGLIWGIVTIILSAIYFKFKDGGIYDPIEIAIVIAIGLIAFPVVTYYYLCMIFQVDENEKRDNTFLSKDDFTEVFYKASNRHTSEGEMILRILEKEEIKFFAKLMEDNNILLVVTNKNDKEIYKCRISNFCYFDEYFSKEEI